MSVQGIRHFIKVAFILILVYTKQFIASWCGFKPLLLDSNGKPSRILVAPNEPAISRFRRVKLHLLWIVKTWLPRSFPGYTLINRQHAALIKVIENDVRQQCERQDTPLEIPTYDWRNSSADQFYEEFVKHPTPVVLKGFAQCESVCNWEFQSFIDRYGDTQVNLNTLSRDYVGSLREVLQEGVYCANADAVFQKHPELNQELGIDRLAPMIRRDAIVNQLFIGGDGTGSGHHCAGVWNFFIMVSGQKRWTFVDPAWTWLMYPAMQPGVIAFASLLSFPDRADLDYYPLYRYCPRFTTLLEPGDVLLNPPWWWHAVENITDTSIAVATRWSAIRGDSSFSEVNRMFAFLSIFNSSFPGILSNILAQRATRSAIKQASMLDERDPIFTNNDGNENQKTRNKNAYQGAVAGKIAAGDKW